MLDRLGKFKWLIAAAFFGLCAAPTFISYQRYLFSWDDSDYLTRSILVSRAFWSLNVHGLGAMVSIRPPAMALLGIPWGALTSWDTAGLCFITLAAAISLFVAICLYLLLRIGVKPLYLAAGSFCVLASMGPYPPSPPYFSMSIARTEATTHFAATGFLADSLFAWTVLAALLLIPYEARTERASTSGALLRGILWGAILSVGALTKLDFLYFVVSIVPILFTMRFHRHGTRSALVAFAGFACCSAPAAFYLLHWGNLAIENAKSSSFGKLANLNPSASLSQFLGYSIRQVPGLLLLLGLTIAALAYLAAKKRIKLRNPDLLALLIVVIFGIVVLASPARALRYAFPSIVGLPFLTAILMSGKLQPLGGRSATLLAGLVFCGLAAAGVPTRHRASEASLSRPNAVLAQAARCHARRILLLTDSPTLNWNLMQLAVTVSGREASANGVEVSTLATAGRSNVPVEEDFRAINNADAVVFQDMGPFRPKFTNARALADEQYLSQASRDPIRVAGDVSIDLNCR